MLKDLSFLQPGKPFLPEDAETRDRMSKYEINRLLFEGKHKEVYNAVQSKMKRIIPNFADKIDFVSILNYQRLLSLKVADLLFSDEPLIKVKEESPEEKILNEIIEASDLINTNYSLTIDLTRYGDGVYYVYKDEELKTGVISLTSPDYWFPIVDETNRNKINMHVLAWRYSAIDDRSNKKKHYLKVQIHEKGQYEEQIWPLAESNSVKGPFKLGTMISSNTVPTGLSDFAVVPVINLQTTNKTTGYDDYENINTIVYEMMVRLTQISKILDKHASPSLQGPVSALEQDPVTGEWRVKLANYFTKNDKDDADVKYLTWEGQLDSAFKELEFLINCLYIMGETSPSLFGDTNKSGEATSGTALRLRMISPLAKAKRLKNRIDPKLKHVLSLASELSAKTIKKSDITIVWGDGLPADPKEDAEIMQLRTGNKATMSVNRALKQYDRMNNKNADEEMLAIQSEEEMSNPLTTPAFGTK